MENLTKPKILVITMGGIPLEINWKKIKSLKSKYFDISLTKDFPMPRNSDGIFWEYTDDQLINNIPKSLSPHDILLVVSSVKLEGNFYTRILKDNIIITSFYNTYSILSDDNIPLENQILREVYRLAIGYRCFNGKITFENAVTLTNDQNTGCISDMNGDITSISNSAAKLKMSKMFQTDLHRIYKIDEEYIEGINKEMGKFKKGLYYRIANFIKKKPILSIILAFITGIIVDFSSQILYNLIFPSK